MQIGMPHNAEYVAADPLRGEGTQPSRAQRFREARSAAIARGDQCEVSTVPLTFGRSGSACVLAIGYCRVHRQEVARDSSADIVDRADAGLLSASTTHPAEDTDRERIQFGVGRYSSAQSGRAVPVDRGGFV